MIELNTKQAASQFSSILSEVGTQGSRVRIIDGEKVVAEIIPAAAQSFRSHFDPHADDSQTDNAYKTIGETLKDL